VHITHHHRCGVNHHSMAQFWRNAQGIADIGFATKTTVFHFLSPNAILLLAQCDGGDHDVVLRARPELLDWRS